MAKSVHYLVILLMTLYHFEANEEGNDVSREDGPVETLPSFFDALGESLKGKEGADTSLADILKTHILKVAPAQNAVAQAKDAILKLAGERTNPPKPQVADG